MMPTDLRALTLVQPWGTAIIHHGKDIENRDWAPPPALFGKRIAIHAGKKLDKDDAWNLKRELGDVDLSKIPVGAILGTVELVGYVYWPKHLHGEWTAPHLHQEQVDAALTSRWRSPNAKCLWVVRRPLALSEPIPCVGALGLWRVPNVIVERMGEVLP